MGLKHTDIMFEKYVRKSLAFIVAMSISFVASALTRTEEHHFFRHWGMDREYLLYIPEGIGPDAPLVMVLHGYGGRAMKGGINGEMNGGINGGTRPRG